jgi:hypothetical protein
MAPQCEPTQHEEAMIRSVLNTIASALALSALVLSLAACGDGAKTAQTTGSVNLYVTANGGLAPAGASLRPASVSIGNITITTAQASFREIEFIMAGVAQPEPEFEATFYVDLLAGTTTAALLGRATIPPGTYEGIEFKLVSTATPPAGFENLAGFSIYIAGTVTPAAAAPVAFTLGVAASGGREQIVVTGANGFTVAPGMSNDLIVDFNIPGVLAHNPEAETVASAIAAAVAAGGPPPVDLSGNAPLVTLLLDALRLEANAGEDDDHDGRLDDSEHMR